MDSIEALQDALAQFKGGVVIVSHDERFIDTVCNEIWVCNDGRLSKFAGGIKDYKVNVIIILLCSWTELELFHDYSIYYLYRK